MAIKLMLGICVIAASVIGILWFTYFAGTQNGEVVPREASQWHIGKGAQYNPVMRYDISTNTTKFSARIEFLPSTNPGNQTLFVQINPNTNEEINQTVPVNIVYNFNQVSDNAKPFFTILDSTVFSIRDLAIENKYLVKGATWGDMYIHDIQEEIKVTNYSKVSLKFGSLDSYIISYKEGQKENKLWVVDNLPLPVKAEVYDLSGNLQYSYELTSLSAPLTPGFS
ncbi:MAG: hypothetical protein HY223_06315 [Thaumarchaeota archaeon]|nr:hypothetical protein [Nitrososphaerota archaeon]